MWFLENYKSDFQHCFTVSFWEVKVKVQGQNRRAENPQTVGWNIFIRQIIRQHEHRKSHTAYAETRTKKAENTNKFNPIIYLAPMSSAVNRTAASAHGIFDIKLFTRFLKILIIFYNSVYIEERLKLVGSLIATLPQIYCWVCQWKNFENQSIFDEVMKLCNLAD